MNIIYIHIHHICKPRKSLPLSTHTASIGCSHS